MTDNQLYVEGELLDLDDASHESFYPTFQANDRSKPESIQSSFTPEVSLPGSQRNHRLLGQAGTGQETAGTPYRRLQASLVCGGIEVLPFAILILKGYRGGRYHVQLVGGNKRWIEALNRPDGKPKLLSELDLSRYNHEWTPANIIARLSYDYFEQHGYGYEVYDRGKEVDLDTIDPYSLYPSISARLVWEQLLLESGFAATDLTTEPIFNQLNIPTAKPYSFSEDFREARGLVAGWRYQDGRMFRRYSEFGPVVWFWNYVDQAPYQNPTEADFSNHQYTVSTLGFYSLSASLEVVLSCAPSPARGEVSAKVAIQVNGNQVGTPGEIRVGNYTKTTLVAKAERILLQPGDVVRVIFQGDEWQTFGGWPTNPFWQVGTSRPFIVMSDGRIVDAPIPYNPNLFRIDIVNQFRIELLAEWPRGGIISLSDWLPAEMTQLEFVKCIFQLLNATVQTDLYSPTIYISTGERVLANVGRALDWSAKLDRSTGAEGLPERETEYRFGDYAQRNELRWKEDDTVAKGYGDGAILIEDESLPAVGALAELPFSASQPSQALGGFLKILGYKRRDPNPAVAAEYDTLNPLPRLVLRPDNLLFNIGVVTNPDRPPNTPAQVTRVTTAASYFASAAAPFDLSAERTILPRFWGDLKAILKGARHLKEYFRLTPRDIAELDFAIPIWCAPLGDYFLVSAVREYSSNQSVQCEIVRLHPTLIPPPTLGTGQEFYSDEFFGPEFW
ncbi:hypothetical protein GCM10023185_29810 [Hymenobacter saemangeumensis]|uniref:Tip attachment protein J domain-containing protein n=1 Tax=Hymenobacter saemangeumensis TaxID=1084522 RepID=A0ABP8IL59_9BACT